MELTEYRERFPILAETTYLISHSLGPMPDEAERRLAQYAHTWRTRGVRAWGEGWWELPMTVGDQPSSRSALETSTNESRCAVL